MVLEKWQSHKRKTETRLLSLSPYAKINSKEIKCLNIRPETIHGIEKILSTKLMDLGLRVDVINLTPYFKMQLGELLNM